MSTPVQVHVDTSGLIRWRSRLDASVVAAASKAGGDAIRAMRAEGSRRIRERKAMKVAAINKALTLIFPNGKQQLLWKLKASGAVVPLAAFPHRQTKRGVAVEVNRGSRSLVPSAFVAQMRSGHAGIFLRRGKPRLPIREAFTTRVADAFRDALPAVTERGRTVFASTFTRVLPLEAARRRT